MAREQRKISTTEKGAAFEQQVSQYYEALGYRVTRNQRLLGHQIDLMASKDVPGAGIVNVMIEAKYRATGAVGINEITNHLNAAQHLIAGRAINSAVIIASTAFTEEARSSIGGQSSIQLMTLHGLQQQLFNSTESLLRVRRDYSERRSSAEYIALSATSSAQKRVPDIAAHVHYNCAYGGHLLILLGDFGSGKTTILERVFDQCAKDRLHKPAAPFPVFLRLRSWRQYSDLWTFISSNLRDYQYINVPKHVFFAQLKAGRLAVFLDGFDEIYTGASVSERAEFLSLLYPLLNTLSPCVLSSRPTYFSSPQEMLRALSVRLGGKSHLDRTPNDSKTRAALSSMRKAIGLGGEKPAIANLFDQIWTIDQLTEEKILQYLTLQESALKGITGKSAIEVRSVLDRIYDLHDLMRRPLLLDMVVQTILGGLVDINTSDLAIGPSTLYETYTQFSFERDSEKHGSGSLSAESRRTACQLLAVTMAKSGSIELSNEQVRLCVEGAEIGSFVSSEKRGAPASARRTPSRLHVDEGAIERVLTDIRVSSFLVFGREGTLRFAHKSYMEFFVSQFICQSALTNPDALSRTGDLSLSREVVYFLGSYARDHSEFGKWLVRRTRTSPRRGLLSREAVLRIMFASGVLLSESSHVGEEIHDVEMRRASVDRTEMTNCNIRDALFSDVSASRWLVAGASWEDCELTRVSFSDCSLEIEARNCAFLHISLQGGVLRLGGSGWVLDKALVKGASVKLSGSGVLGGVRFEKSAVELAIDSRSDHRLEAADCGVYSKSSLAPFRWNDGVQLRNCRVFGLVMSLEQARFLLPLPNSNVPQNGSVIDFESEGIVFVDTRRVGQVNTAEWASISSGLKSRYKHLVFVELQPFQRAIDMSPARRAKAMKYMKSGSALRQQSRSVTDDVEAVGVALDLANSVKQNEWSGHPAAEHIVTELLLSGFMDWSLK